jgi:hypothetical protein
MYYKIAEVRQAAQQFQTRQYVHKSADALVRESAEFSEGREYDIFLSHSFSDAELILGVKQIIEGQGRTVYVDWIEDKTLDRKNVTRATAEVLRRRMKSCKSLVYATSENSSESKWMPWELGYFDGFRPDKISILPLVETYDSEWKGQEYLGLYPVIEKLKLDQTATPFVIRDANRLQLLREFGNSSFTPYSITRG